jgi:hypothetical protein
MTVDPLTGMTDEELERAADEDYAHRDDPGERPDEPDMIVDPNASSVVSVRFKRGELDAIEAAATRAGVPFSTFVRQAALAASAGHNDVHAVREVLQHVEAELAEASQRLLRAVA